MRLFKVLFAVTALFSLSGVCFASDIIYTSDTTISFSDPNTTITILEDSRASSVTINEGSLNVTLAINDQMKLTSSTHHFVFDGTVEIGSQTCYGDRETLVISGVGNATISLATKRCPNGIQDQSAGQTGGGSAVFLDLENSSNSSNSGASNSDIERENHLEATQPQTGDEVAQPTSTYGQLFSDTKGHWAESYIYILVENKIANGYSPEKFGPNQGITRAEFLKMAINTSFLLNVFDQEELNLTPTETDFPDVRLDAWYAAYINFAKEKELVSGYADGLFRPNETVSREEAIKILYNLLDLAQFASNTEYQNQFVDIKPEKWYTPFIHACYELGIIKGYEDDSFGLNKKITRAESAKILVKTMELFPDAKVSWHRYQSSSISSPIQKHSQNKNQLRRVHSGIHR